MCDQRTLLSSYVSGFRFYRGFLLPFLVTLRKVAANASHYLQVFYSACCYHSIFEYLSHFPRLFIWAAFVRFFGCSLCVQKDYLHKLHESLLFRHFREGYFCIKIKFDTNMYGTFRISMVSAIHGKKILKISV